MSFVTVINPNIAFAALIAGVLGIYVELGRPGLVLPGAAGAVLVLLALFALPMNATDAVLLAAAPALFFLEARFSARGILAAAGACALVFGAVAMRVHALVALALALPFSFVTMRRLSLIFRARRSKAVRPRDPL